MTRGEARKQLHLGPRPKSVGKGADQKLRAEEAGHNDAVVEEILLEQQNAKQWSSS